MNRNISHDHNLTRIDPLALSPNMRASISQFTWLHWLTVVMSVITLTGNLSLLSIFYKLRELLTPFTIYIISLLLANIAGALFTFNPFIAAINSLLTEQDSPFFCAFPRFFAVAIGPLSPLYHMSIALNRLWAVTWPLSYRSKHTKRTAIIICILCWAAITAFAVTVTTVDTVLYSDALDNVQCSYSRVVPSEFYWLPFHNWAFYALPEIVIVISYPYFVIRRRKIAVGTRKTANSSDTDPLPFAVAHAETGKHRHIVDKRSSGSFFLLSLMTFSVAVCWSVSNIYFMSGTLLANNRVLYLTGRIFKMAQATLDPVIFAFARPRILRK
ncbi:mas-related G-protein coupled receptor member B5-like [Paramacrobiotus metropolitanus]|uniref:mas-related G-protein coupled receptor member B5-like n=1 Tax=Paramacrobiotus metropolitanus TaxID=2943436 RepID=UPI0024463D3D|nr:mas-related G-protein coupled receptor member B5-like [Paramacrobiotus metropolitanus]